MFLEQLYRTPHHGGEKVNVTVTVDVYMCVCVRICDEFITTRICRCLVSCFLVLSFLYPTLEVRPLP
jgi:hypothetical protein